MKRRLFVFHSARLGRVHRCDPWWLWWAKLAKAGQVSTKPTRSDNMKIEMLLVRLSAKRSFANLEELWFCLYCKWWMADYITSCWMLTTRGTQYSWYQIPIPNISVNQIRRDLCLFWTWQNSCGQWWVMSSSRILTIEWSQWCMPGLLSFAFIAWMRYMAQVPMWPSKHGKKVTIRTTTEKGN